MSPTVFREGPYRFFFFSRGRSGITVVGEDTAGAVHFREVVCDALAERCGAQRRRIAI